MRNRYDAGRRSGVSALLLAVCLAAAVPVALAWDARPAAAQQSETDVFVAQAILAYDARRYDAALAFLEEALAQEPNNVEALYYKGLVLMAQQKTEAAIAPLEAAHARAPKDFSVRYLLGAAYFSLERYDQAEPLLTQIFNERPQTDGVGYYVGLMRYRKKDYQGALKAFQAETSTNPNIRQLAKFYSGLTLAIMGLPEQAVAAVDEALRAQSGSALTGPAERIRESLVAAGARERRFHVSLRTGFLFDTNVAISPQPSHDPIGEAVRTAFRRRGLHSFGEIGEFRLDYTWLRRQGPESKLESTLTYDFLETYYNERTSFSVQTQLGAATITYQGLVFNRPYQVGAGYTFDYFMLGTREFLQRNTVNAFATFVENQTNLTSLLGQVQFKDFAHDSNLSPDESRDARNWLVGVLHMFPFSPDPKTGSPRHYVRLGYQFDYENTDGRNARYLGNRYLFGAQYTLPWQSTVARYDFNLHQRDYVHANTLLPITDPGTRERFDLEQNHDVRIDHRLARSFGPASIGCSDAAPCPLTLSAEFQRTVNRSNLPVFSYDRNVYLLTLTWQY